MSRGRIRPPELVEGTPLIRSRGALRQAQGAETATAAVAAGGDRGTAVLSVRDAVDHRLRGLRARAADRIDRAQPDRLLAAQRAAVRRAGQLPAADRRSAVLPVHDQHGLLRRRQRRPERDLHPAAGDPAQLQGARAVAVPGDLLSAVDRRRHRHRSALAQHPRPGLRPDQPDARLVRHPGAGLVAVAGLGDPGTGADERLGCRQHDRDLPGRPAVDPGHHVRSGAARRGRSWAGSATSRCR